MTLGGFFSGGAKGITWPERPDSPGGRPAVTGVIEQIHPPEPIIDLVTQQPTDKMQVRIILKTEERDPTDPDDDGRRTLYVKSWMRSAIGEALRKASAKEPEVGGTLAVQFTHVTPPERPGLSPSKHFSATYSAPPVTAGYFTPPQGTPTAPVYTPPAAAPAAAPVYTPPPAAAPPAVPPAPAAAPQVPAAVGAIVAQPPGISDAAWAAMDDATKATLAAAMTAQAAPPPY